MLEKVGYVRVQNPNTDNHLWKIKGRRQAVYGLRLCRKERGSMQPCNSITCEA